MTQQKPVTPPAFTPSTLPSPKSYRGAIVRLDTPNGDETQSTFLQSNGVAWAAIGGGTTRVFRGNVANQAAMLAVSANVSDWVKRDDLSGQSFELTALPATTLANWVASTAAGSGDAVREAVTSSINLSRKGAGTAIPLTPGAQIAVNADITLTVAAGAVEDGVWQGDYISGGTGIINFPTTYPGAPTGAKVQVNGGFDPEVDRKYRIIAFIAAGDLVFVVKKLGASAPSILAPNAATLAYGTAMTTTQPLTITPGGVDGSHSAATAYQVYYSSDGGATYSAFGPPSSILTPTVTGLTASTSYKYKVVAINSAGSAPDSNVVTNSTAAGGSGSIVATLICRNEGGTLTTGTGTNSFDLSTALDIVLPSRYNGTAAVGAASDFVLTGGTRLQPGQAVGFTNSLDNGFGIGLYGGGMGSFDFSHGSTPGTIIDHVDLAAYLGGGSGAQSYKARTTSSAASRKMVIAFGFDNNVSGYGYAAKRLATLRCYSSDGTTLADIPLTSIDDVGYMAFIYQIQFSPASAAVNTAEILFNDGTNLSTMAGPMFYAIMP